MLYHVLHIIYSVIIQYLTVLITNIPQQIPWLREDELKFHH